MSDDNVSCQVKDNTVQCMVDGQEPDRMIDGHRDIVEQELGQVASMESCSRLSEAFLQEYHGTSIDSPARTTTGLAMVYNGCPIPEFEEDNE